MDQIFSAQMVSILTICTVFALLMAQRPAKASRNIEARIKTYLGRSMARGQDDPAILKEVEGSFFQRAILPSARRLLQLLSRLSPSKNMELIEKALTAAGRPGRLTAAEFLGIQVGLAVLGLVMGLLLPRLLPSGNARLAMLAPIGGVFIGYMLPKNWLSARGRKRSDAIQRALPDALDMLTICVEAGLAFESAMQRVSDQWQSELSDEFGRVVAEIRLGVQRSQALRRLAQRCASPDVASFVAVLVQADAMGTSISQVLHSQSDQMRVLRRQRAEERANKAPIKVLIPMVMFIFPALMVVLLGPAIPKFMAAFSGTGGP